MLRSCIYKSGEKVIEIINVGRGLFLDHLGLSTSGGSLPLEITQRRRSLQRKLLTQTSPKRCLGIIGSTLIISETHPPTSQLPFIL